MPTIFISHSSKDKNWAEQVHNLLSENHYQCLFLDSHPDDGIHAGADWERTLYQRLRQSRGVIVLCSANWLASPWCVAEAIMARERKRRVFLMATADVFKDRRVTDTQDEAPQIPDFLKDGQFISVSDVFDDGAYQLLLRGLEREGLRRRDFKRPDRPYPGLEAFQEADAGVFFGRDDEIDQVINILHKHRKGNANGFVLVLGASGCGKSSLVRAGVLPKLKRSSQDDRAGAAWVVVPPFLGGKGLAGLALTFAQSLKDAGQPRDLAAVRGCLNAPSDLGMLGTELLLSHNAPQGYVLITLDQLEEVFGTAKGSAARAALRLLLDASADPASSIVVLATMRSDFLNAFQLFEGAAKRYEEVPLDPMLRSHFSEVIEGPADLFGLDLDAGLSERMVTETAYSDALPLLSFTLEKLYDKCRAQGRLTVSAYNELGGVSAAIKHVADEVLTETGYTSDGKVLPDDDQRIRDLRRAFYSLAQLGEEGQFTCRTARWSQMPGSCTNVLERLVKDRLLVSGKDDKGEPILSVAHEALFRVWDTLNHWLREGQDLLRTRERVAAQAKLWNDELRLPERLLRHGRPLAEGEDLLATFRADLEPLLVEFIEASTAAARASVEAERRNHSRALAALADFEAEIGSPATAVRIALSAVSERLSDPDRVHAREAEGTVLHAWQKLREVRRIDHSAPVHTVIFSPDGRTLATGSQDGTARLWDRATGREIATLLGHQGQVRSVAFSPDGLILATGSDDNTARLWEVATGREIIAMRGHERDVRSLAFSPDGRMLATGAFDRTARVWEVMTGREITALRGHSGEVYSVAFSPDGLSIATGSSDSAARLWEVKTGKEVTAIRGDARVCSVAFSPDGKTLAIGAWNDVRLWELATGFEMTTLRGHEGEVLSITFSPDGQMLATGSGDSTARLWEAATGKEIAIFRGHDGDVNSVAFSPDGQTLATGAVDNARLWQVMRSKITTMRGHDGTVWSVAFSPDGQTMATGSLDSTARLWEVTTGKETTTICGHDDEMYSVSSVAFSPDGRILAIARWDIARLWDLAIGKEIAALRHEGQVNSLAFSCDCRTLATGSSDAAARLWDVLTGKEISALRGHTGDVNSVVFSPDSLTLASGSDDNTARLWEVATGREITTLRGHEGAVNSLVFSPDGQTLASGSDDNTARLWEVATGREITTLRGSRGEVFSVAFSPDGLTVATGSADDAARLWDVLTGKEISALRGHTGDVNSVVFSPDGQTLATASQDGTARLWPIYQRLIDLACARVHELPLSERDRLRFGVDNEWCTPKVSAALRAKLGYHDWN